MTILTKYDLAIIGGGILGASLSYWLSILYDLKVCVIEKESSVAMHTSSRNTGVVHSPFYLHPKKRSKSAKSSLISHDLWKTLAYQQNVPWKEVGTIEVAIEGTQHRTLEKYLRWGKENGIPAQKLELLDRQQLKKKEPNLDAHSGLFCKMDVSTDFGKLTQELQKLAKRNGIKFLFGHNVDNVQKESEITLNFSNGNSLQCDFVINCAGGHSLDVAKMFDLAHQYDDLHFRGEYWIADKFYEDLVKTNIYSVARFSEFPFLDPHWIKRSNGTTEIGPNAVPVATPETYSGYAGEINEAITKLREVFSGNVRRLLTNSSFLQLISKEFLSSISKTAMISRVKKFIPSLRPEYFSKRGTAGIRTPIITPQGNFLSDILELYDSNSLHILNYNSPGATGAPTYSALIIYYLQEKGILPNNFKQKKSVWNFEKVMELYNKK